MLRLFLLFTLVPMLEICFLLEIGRTIGILDTILLVFVTGFVGAWLARRQGLQALFQVRMNLQQGVLPAEEIVDAMLILIAGLLLLTPGLLTDLVGILLLVPACRQWFKRYLRRKFDEWLATHEVHLLRF
ncbi:MAG: FxsA family protein [Deltaproteobacteria bacterium]|jgi:UPF0716 protein FxsA|nr:FxsA family protein [Deltaproteobacteria bacterium]